MKRTPIRRSQKRLIRYRTLAAMSQKREEDLPRRRRVSAKVLNRDGHRCIPAWAFPDIGCGGGLHVHHLLKASAGGKYEEDNLVACCDVHNTAIEDRPDIAEEAGLVRRDQKGNNGYPRPI